MRLILMPRMRVPPFFVAGRVRQWLGAVQAAMVVGRASEPPATPILSRASTTGALAR